MSAQVRRRTLMLASPHNLLQLLRGQMSRPPAKTDLQFRASVLSEKSPLFP